MSEKEPDWTPSAEDVEAARITEFAHAASERARVPLTHNYPRLWE
ncbi:hypothetical protein OG528_34375 [Streptomyces platensis]